MEKPLLQGFSLAHIYLLTSHSIWLALDDNEHGNHRVYTGELTIGEFIGLPLCEHFHRQLFYWLLVRGKPQLYSGDCRPHRTVPHHLLCQN